MRLRVVIEAECETEGDAYYVGQDLIKELHLSTYDPPYTEHVAKTYIVNVSIDGGRNLLRP